MMNEYYVTFGQQYPREPHPKVDYADHNGWLVVMATDMTEAREKAFAELGSHWAFIYTTVGFDREYFPKGELHRI